jgi:hypothetical protein
MVLTPPTVGPADQEHVHESWNPMPISQRSPEKLFGIGAELLDTLISKPSAMTDSQFGESTQPWEFENHDAVRFEITGAESVIVP